MLVCEARGRARGDGVSSDSVRMPRIGQVGVNPPGLSLAVRKVPIERTATKTGKLCKRGSYMRGVKSLSHP